MRRNQGITLIALIITIIILLILAGIAIAQLSDSGLFEKSKKARIESKIANLEEEANLVYTELKISEYMNEKNKPTMSEVVINLIDKGYEIKQVEESENAITGIALNENKITLKENGTNYIIVKYEENIEANSIGYFVEIDGKKYRMTLTENGIKVERKPRNIDETVISTLEATSNNENVIVESINGNIITVKSKTEQTISEINVTYGKFSAKCEVHVNPNLTKFSVTNYKIDIDNDGDYTDDWNVLYEGEEGLFLIASKCIDYTKYPKSTMIEHGYGTLAYSETNPKMVSPWDAGGFTESEETGYIADLTCLSEFPGNEELLEKYSKLSDEEKKKWTKSRCNLEI